MKNKLFLITLIILILSIVYAINDSPSPYGVNVHIAENVILNKVKDAGIKWIRVGANWSVIESTKGNFNWSEVDRVANYASNNGLSVVLIIAYTPDWANNGKGTNYPATDVNEWTTFVRRVINRYKNRVKYYSIWNEPNIESFFGKPKNVFLNQIFKPAAKEIRALNPNARIVGPDLAHLTAEGQEWYFWLKYILDNAGQYVDVISHHIYKNEGASYIYEILEDGVNFIPAVKDIISDAGYGDKKFWITETGWNTSNVSESVQADHYLEILYKMKEKGYPDKLFFYEIIDIRGVPPWGILRWDGTKKASYNVYKDFIDGKYDDIEDPDPDIDDKTCFLEQLQANNSLSPKIELNKIRKLRTELIACSNFGNELVKLYYRVNQDLLKISFSHPQILSLTLEIVNLVNKQVKNGTDVFLNMPLNREILIKGHSVLKILREQNVSVSFKSMINVLLPELNSLETLSIKQFLNTPVSMKILTAIKSLNSLIEKPKNSSLLFQNMIKSSLIQK